MDEIVDEEVVASGSSTAGDIRQLLLNINVMRESLIKCGYNEVTINAVEATIDDGKRKKIVLAMPDVEGRFNDFFNKKHNILFVS
jgi:hypothetical protein